MKVIRVRQFGEPEVLVLEEAADPVIGPGQVLLETRAIGVNPVETYIRAGKFAGVPLPWTPGSDAAGVVIAVGESVSQFRPGDRVFTFKTLSGSYATKVLALAETVRKLPDNVSFEAGAALGIAAATAYRALLVRAGTKAGETVLVHGATGGVGTVALQLARAMGCTVIASAGTDEGKKLALELGANHVINHGDVEQVMKLTDGRGVNVIIEMLANQNLNKDLQMLAQSGRLVIVGSRGPIEIDPRLTMGKETEIRGMMLSPATPGEVHGMYAALIAALAAGFLRIPIGKRIPLAEAPRAHREIIEGKALGKMVLVP